MMSDVSLVFLVAFICLLSIIVLFILSDLFKAFIHRQKTISLNAKKVKSENGVSYFRVGQFDEDSVVELGDNQSESREFLVEEFSSPVQECLVVILNQSSSHVVGICAFLNDQTVEYFVENFPICCKQEHNEPSREAEFEASYRGVMSGVSLWAEKWVYAEAISLLCQNGALVKCLNTPGSQHQRLLKQFERRHEFKAFPQWTDNFTCDDLGNEEFWEKMIRTAKKLLSNKNDEDKKLWSRFPLKHWDRKRVKPNTEHFHQVPHPGKIEDLQEDCAPHPPMGEKSGGKNVRFKENEVKMAADKFVSQTLIAV